MPAIDPAFLSSSAPRMAAGQHLQAVIGSLMFSRRSQDRFFSPFSHCWCKQIAPRQLATVLATSWSGCRVGRQVSMFAVDPEVVVLFGSDGEFESGSLWRFMKYLNTRNSVVGHNKHISK